ncbi:ROK family protein [Agromyces allii]|uniref:ROK family transcriptional regulator n=1 Tax=Agromyces allii TaxID=393607 RepID=A0ABN2PXY7_9MICO|nr:ROK family protein [Agromyces allii]
MSRTPGSGGADLRSMNARQVLGALHGQAQPQTVAELAGAVRLTRPTVEAALAELAGMGWIDDLEPEASPNRVGRRARRYRFNADAGLLMGVDVGPHAVTCLIADLNGTVLHSEEQHYDDHGDAATAWAVISTVVDRAIAAVPERPLLATTVGVPAVVGPDGVIAYSVVVPGWLRADIPSLITSSFPSEATYFDNDVKLATLAEAEWGRLAGVDHAIFLLAGRQIGAGVIVNGRLTRGANGAAGEIGGLDSVDWASAPIRLNDSFEPRIPIEEIFERAAGGDPEAVGAVAVFARDLAEGVAALALTVDPEVVVVSGEAALAGDAFLVPLRRALTSLALSTPRVERSSLDTRAVALGAVARSLDHLRASVLELPKAI